MNILINLAPLKAGGGQNVGLNLLSGLQELDDTEVTLFYYVSAKTIISEKIKHLYPNQFIEGPHNTVKRVLFERTKLRRFIARNNIDIVYSCFGYAWVGKRTKQVCGMAESNIMFPEINFWKEYTGFKRFIKDAVDAYRKWGYLQAEALVFENEAMYKRNEMIFGKGKKATFIRPSIAISDEGNGGFRLEKYYEDSKVGLFLCGWQLNKNIMIIPDLVRLMKDLGVHFEIIITVGHDDANPIATQFKNRLNNLQVSDYVHMVGKVDRKNLSALYRKIDYVFLLSRLESFSNNIIESWYFEKPLIISDAEWARGICKDAAVYVDRDDPKEIVKKIIEAEKSGDINKVVLQGIEECRTYPSIQERTRQEICYVKKIAKET